MQVTPHATVTVQAANSRAGLAELAAGRADIALVSRPLRATETQNARVYEIARDGIALVINPQNSLTNISREETARAFSGEILEWSALKAQLPQGASQVIAVVSREAGSGTRDVFEQTVLPGRRVTLTAIVMPGEGAVVDYVAAQPDALGYVSYAAVADSNRVKILAIDGIPLTRATLDTGQYPLIRSLYFVTRDEPNAGLDAFLSFVQSDEGQAIVERRYARVR
jgi:phosphate transport system substrate-binding protein